MLTRLQTAVGPPWEIGFSIVPNGWQAVGSLITVAGAFGLLFLLLYVYLILVDSMLIQTWWCAVVVYENPRNRTMKRNTRVMGSVSPCRLNRFERQYFYIRAFTSRSHGGELELVSVHPVLGNLTLKRSRHL